MRFDDLPPIDLVLVSHNHYDHMDLPTLRRLWRRDRPLIVTSLGNDTIVAGGGARAVARDWGGRVAVRPGVDVIVERNHHWGSRWFVDRNRALWSAFTVRTPGGNIFFAGDTGWGGGDWVREAARRGPFRLAIIPIGAYEPRDVMASNHVNPEEAMAHLRDPEPGFRARHSLGHVPAHLRGHRRSAAKDRPPRSRTRPRPEPLRRHRGRPDVQRSSGTMRISAFGRIR